MTKICIVGCTGSIGTQTVEAVRSLNAHGYEFAVTAVAFGSDYTKAAGIIKEFSPACVAVISPEAAETLVKTEGIKPETLFTGADAATRLCETADYDICVNAAVGIAGLLPSYAVIRRSKKLALANKETIVTDGENVMAAAARYKAVIIPLDSEHSAIFQCLNAGRREDVSKLIITASGGPFFGKDEAFLTKVTAADALKNPNWKMGKKVTVDSSTLVNKGFEVIEASRLFGIPPERIEVVVHRESIIHSMVEFNDGAVIAQLGQPDMRLPIQYGLVYPHRPAGETAKLDFGTLKSLSFAQPDMKTFKGLALSLAALNRGGNATAVLNAADEIAVEAFLKGKIGFTAISGMIETALDSVAYISDPDTEDIITTDRVTREVLSRKFLSRKVLS